MNIEKRVENLDQKEFFHFAVFACVSQLAQSGQFDAPLASCIIMASLNNGVSF